MRRSARRAIRRGGAGSAAWGGAALWWAVQSHRQFAFAAAACAGIVIRLVVETNTAPSKRLAVKAVTLIALSIRRGAAGHAERAVSIWDVLIWHRRRRECRLPGWLICAVAHPK